jgi:hypothetical protein
MLSTCVFDAGIELEQVDEAARVDFAASAALAARRSVTPVSQFNAFAMMRASVVLPTPRVPVKRYAWCSGARAAHSSARARRAPGRRAP